MGSPTLFIVLNVEKILGGCTEVGCGGRLQVQRVPSFFKRKMLPLGSMIHFNYLRSSTNENPCRSLFYRAAGWTLLHAREEEGPSCAAAFVEVLSPKQQPVAILRVNLEFLIHVWVAFIMLSLI